MLIVDAESFVQLFFGCVTLVFQLSVILVLLYFTRRLWYLILSPVWAPVLVLSWPIASFLETMMIRRRI